MACCNGGNGDEVILIFKTQAGLLTGNFRVAFLAVGMLVGLGIKDQPNGEASAKKNRPTRSTDSPTLQQQLLEDHFCSQEFPVGIKCYCITGIIGIYNYQVPLNGAIYFKLVGFVKYIIRISGT
jgi:hypothetical protein